jgi:ABC-type antimicrobial peptide transport system permease subunit
MIRNYFTVALRNLAKNKASSFINIGGLAVGMAIAMLIGLWIYDELSFDKYHKNYDRIAQVMQHQTSNGTVYSMTALPYPLANELQTNYSGDFKYITMASWQGDHILSYGEKKITKNGMFMQPDGARMLTMKMLTGSYDALADMNSILLSATTAKLFFADANDAFGKIIRLDNKVNVKVTGVYEDLPFNTQFKDLTYIAPWDLYVSMEPWVQRAKNGNEWNNNSFQLFAQIADNTDFKTVDKRIIQSKQKYVPAEDKKYNAQIYLHPMKDWHLRSHWDNNGIKTGGAVEYVWMFSIVGVFVLLLACINFMNLSTARSEKRAKEVGIRKAIGSIRKQLIWQFYSESLLVVVFAFILSVVLAQLSITWFDDVAGKKMMIPWGEPLFWTTGVAFTLITGFVAGSYPALYLSSFQPVKVLKGTFKTGRLASLPRKVLVVVQFTISLALIIGTIIVYSQIVYTKNRPIGYDRNGLMMVEMKSPDYYGKFDLLRTDLKNSGAVQEFAEASSPATDVWSNNGGFTWEGKDPGLDPDFATIWVTHEYGKTVGWQFKAGRDFSRDFATDSSSVVVNEAAVKFMNIKNPVGTILHWGPDRNYKIIGVIKDMIMQSPYLPVKQTVYFMDYENANWMLLKLNPLKSAGESVSSIEASFKKYIPSAPFDCKFADSEFAAKFAAEERVGKLAAFFAVLAIFISCLGLFGLASFVAEQRTKEIGIRKVLGASVTNLWSMLSKDFVVLVVISCFIAAPVAYYFMSKWLIKYEYRTNISWWVFVTAATGAMIITLLTVSFQAIKAAMANPVKSLRSE